MYQNFQSLLDKVKENEQLSIAVVAAHDASVLKAVQEAMQHGLIKPVLIGDEQRIRQIMAAIGLKEQVEIINEPDPARAAEAATGLAKSGQVQGLMKGIINTAMFLRAVLKMGSKEEKKFLSHLAAFEIPGQKKVLFMTDVALNTYPDLQQKRLLLVNAINCLHKLGYERPNVALLSANEVPNEKIPGSLDAQKLVQMNRAGELPAANIEGPMALDVIADKECAEHKGITSKIAGEVDLILVPDIEAGNGIAKAFSHYAGGTMSGVVVGADVPVILASRSDTAKGKFTSIVLALLLK